MRFNMNENNPNQSTAATINLTAVQNAKPENAITLFEAAALLWKHRLLLLAFALVGAAAGLFAGNWIRPQYGSDALVRVNEKNKTGRAMGEMGMLLEMSSPADAEIHMIKSRNVLGYVVEAEGLRYNATPMGFMNRLTHKEGRMDVSMLSLPLENRSGWTAEIVDENSYSIADPEGNMVAKGIVGEMLQTSVNGDTIEILVDKIKGRPGQKFSLSIAPVQAAIKGLAGRLQVAEQGKQTGVIAIKYSHRYPDKAASILNTVVNIYVRQNVEMRNAEAEKTLEFLKAQLPGVKAKLDTAEKRLADYRHQIGSVDMNGETSAHLKKVQDLNMQLLSLEQKRQETARLFKDEHPAVQTITKQQNRVRAELAKLKTSAERMPLTQQEVLSLQEEVSVSNSQYTAMLQNIQQLEVVRAGEVGNIRIVDYATEDPSQTKPHKVRILIFTVGVSLIIGILLIFVMRILRNGVRNALEVERETGIGVYAKIPESQNKILKRNRKGKSLPLVQISPEDPASEALRSMFTAIEFSIATEKPTIMVAGLVAGVGKSFVSKNLAALFANSGKKVLLVDADMRRGVLYSKHRQGLAEVLAQKASLEACVSETDIESLYVLGSGNALQSPTDLLHGKAFANMLAKAKETFDVIIVDTPPISLVADTELILPYVDFALYVLHYGCHTMDQIKESMNKVDRLSNSPKAFVMNHCERETYLGSYGYYNYYGYKKTKK